MEPNKTWSVGQNVIIGAQSLRKIPSLPLQIGDHAIFLSNSTVYEATTIGTHLIIGHYSVIREENIIGNNFKLWNNSDVDYGCRIGNNVKIHSHCYIAQGTIIEDDVFFAPGTVTTNDKYPGSKGAELTLKGPHIRKGAQIGARVVILPGVTIGECAIIGAGSIVTKDIPARSIAFGSPARVVGSIDSLHKEKGVDYSLK